jgi:hypothetical protein
MGALLVVRIPEWGIERERKPRDRTCPFVRDSP